MFKITKTAIIFAPNIFHQIKEIDVEEKKVKKERV